MSSLIAVKGALDNTLEISFGLNFIYHMKVSVNLQIQKENSKIPFENEGIINNMHKVGMGLICIPCCCLKTWLL